MNEERVAEYTSILMSIFMYASLRLRGMLDYATTKEGEHSTPPGITVPELKEAMRRYELKVKEVRFRP